MHQVTCQELSNQTDVILLREENRQLQRKLADMAQAKKTLAEHERDKLQAELALALKLSDSLSREVSGLRSDYEQVRLELLSKSKVEDDNQQL